MSRQRNRLYEFGAYRLDAAERRLTRHAQPVSLAPKTFDLLLVLVENAGHLLEKDELLKRLWPDTFVEEATLAKHVSLLRKILGDTPDGTAFIETVPKAGYRFVAQVMAAEPEATKNAAPEKSEETAPASDGGRAPDARRTGVLFATYLGWHKLRPAYRRLLAVGVCVVLLAASYISWEQFGAPTDATGKRITVGVLPFHYLGGDSSQEYLGDALTEEMITQLSRLNPERLAVIARTSTMKYRDAKKDAAAIGRELGADYLLEGSVLRAGNRVRFTVQLIETSRQVHLWAETYERELAQILPLQSEVSAEVARQIAGKLLPGARSPAPPANPQAYELYLKGRHFWSKRSGDSLDKARRYFAQSIALDPDFAPAHAGRAETCVVDAHPVECEKAEEYARQAVELDASRPEGHVALGVLLMSRFAWGHADTELRRALEVDPNHANAHFWRSAWLLAQGRTEEAIAAAQRARELDPLSALSYHQLGVAYYLARRYDRAVEQFQRALELEPENLWTHLRLAQAYSFLGKSAEFEQAAERAARISPAGAPRIAYARARRGETARAREILARELKNLSRNESSVDIAALFLALGEPDAALRHLEAAVPSRHFDLWYLKVDPRFDALREHPRFTQVLRTLGLEPRAT